MRRAAGAVVAERHRILTAILLRHPTLLGDVAVVTFFLGITITGTPNHLLLALPAGLVAANYSANVAMDRDGQELVWAQDVIPSVKGPMVDLDWIGTEEQTEEWLDTFAEALTGLGWGGKVTAGPEAYLPEDMDPYESRPRLTCYLGASVTDIGRVC